MNAPEDKFTTKMNCTSFFFLISSVLEQSKLFTFKKNIVFIYLRGSTNGKEGHREREKQSPHWAGTPMQDSISGP